MTPAGRVRILPPSTVTWIATAGILSAISFTAAFLLARYPALPDILPVHFNRFDRPNGWQWKTYSRVLMPVLVQGTLALVFGAIATLLLSRSHADDGDREEVAAATAAAEAVALFAFIWVAFQSFAAVALVVMWQRGHGGLDAWYVWAMIAGGILSLGVARRAGGRLGRPTPRAFVAEHWRFGHLYKNPANPALFVPTRDGSRWTLNFGRPVAAVLMAIVLAVGILGPAIILRLLLR